MLDAIKGYRNCRSYKKRIKVSNNVPSTFKYLLELNKKNLGKFARQNGLKLKFSQDKKNKMIMGVSFERTIVYDNTFSIIDSPTYQIPLKYDSKSPTNPFINIVDGVLKRMDDLREQYGPLWRTIFEISHGE